MPTTTALSLRNVTLELGDGDSKVRPLDNVNLEIEHGEFVGVIGPSGAGKSTLLAVAGALATPDSGAVKVLGQDLAKLTRSQGKLAKFRLHNIGFVFQSGNLIPALNAADQLRLVNKISKGPADFDPMPLLEAVGIAQKAKNLPRQLSGGERQRVGIARAFVTNPGLLLVDEPTAALDRQRSQQIVTLLAEQCHERGVATMMVTHDHEVLGHCDRVVEMVDGRLTPVDG
ncbi:MAG: ABC transporter ATP-binding protein [Leucobacter sp.]|nr:ABC transporter ATP-binding protein [Leucobacter sp.]